MAFQPFLLLGAAAICLAFCIRDFRRKDFAWSAAAATSFLIIVTAPIPTHSVTVELPSSK
jgi:hypothetical protein